MSDLPRLNRNRPAPRHGIVHLGIGAFFRSHGALVIEDAMARAGGDFGITGVSLRSPDIRDSLAPQEFAYSAVEMAAEGETRRVVNVLNNVLFAGENPQELIDLMADPKTRIVSLTVTEKGYCHVPSTGELDVQHEDIQHDLSSVVPRSAIGFIVRALQERHRNGTDPFTVLSCDNLPNNGRVARNVVTGFAAFLDPELAEWISNTALFPSTMVDRIVPATTQKNIDRLAADTGVYDAAPVFHEPFLQWVIEDDFLNGERPAFEQVDGVQLVSDVAPFELMKIRMLNGTHSALAYLGYLAGYETIAETVADARFRTFAKHVWTNEIIPSIKPPPGVDLHRYAEDLLVRYENPSIRHRTWQIAMDGSQKLPQRFLGTLADNAAAGRPSDGLYLAVAAWMRYVGGLDEQGQPIDVRDPLAERLHDLSNSAETPREAAYTLLSVEEVFGAEMSEKTKQSIVASYEAIVELGSARCVEREIGST